MTESPGRDLVRGMYNILTERYGPSYLWGQPGGRLPSGIRLEMNPTVYWAIVIDPAFRDDPDLFASGGDISDVFRIPVKIDYDVAEDHWRLVIVKEEEISSGTFRGGKS